MIIGIGTDLLDARRIEQAFDRHKQRFLDRAFSKAEQALFKKRCEHRSFVLNCAKAFAAKEAFVKALGTGFRHGIRLIDVEALRLPSGKPYLSLQGMAAQMLGSDVAHLSLTDEWPYVQAFVVIQKGVFE